MIKHIVMWRLKDHAAGAGKIHDAREIKARLEALRGQIPGLLIIEVGIDFSATPDSCDVVRYSEFADKAALAAYHEHPAHEAVKPFVAEVRAERRLIDYEV